MVEWSLVRVALAESLSLHPNALQDGKFLVDFYICHPGDIYYNAVNQRYWLEYHPILDDNRPNHQATAHLIRPSAQSESYAVAEGLRPFHQWVRLINTDTLMVPVLAIVSPKVTGKHCATNHPGFPTRPRLWIYLITLHISVNIIRQLPMPI